MIYLQISAPPPPPPLCKSLGGHLREPELTKKNFKKVETIKIISSAASVLNRIQLLIDSTFHDLFTEKW